MPLGVVDTDEFEKELKRAGINSDTNESEDNKPRAIIGELVDIRRGRIPGSKETPEIIREIVGVEAANGAKNSTLMRATGLSQSSISAYKNGATSTTTYHEPDPKLANKINITKERISNKAHSRLMMALREIKPESLVGIKPRDLAGIAKDMSAVVKNMEPSIQIQDNSTKVVVYRPHMRDESEFDVITVSE